VGLFEEMGGGPVDAVYWICIDAPLGLGDEGFGDPADELAVIGVVDPGIPRGERRRGRKSRGRRLGTLRRIRFRSARR